ncbi:MAG: GNAT family N-acyltransferase [Acidihalobacter sp.]
MPSIQAARRGDSPSLVAELATTQQQVRESQRLRYRVFAEEMGAHVHTALPGHEADAYDRYCHHLLVRNRRSGEVVASARILTDTQSRLCGGFYSESEFDFSAVLARPGRVIEIGRTCVAPDCRNGAAIGVLWSALARFMIIHRVDYMIGCASISLRDGEGRARAIAEHVRTRHFAPEALRTHPHNPLGATAAGDLAVTMPPLLRAYLRLGAWVCGAPCLDREFNVADLPILLDVDRVDPRYMRHFVHSKAAAPPPTLTTAASRAPSHAYGETHL